MTLSLGLLVGLEMVAAREDVRKAVVWAQTSSKEKEIQNTSSSIDFHISLGRCERAEGGSGRIWCDRESCGGGGSRRLAATLNEDIHRS